MLSQDDQSAHVLSSLNDEHLKNTGRQWIKYRIFLDHKCTTWGKDRTIDYVVWNCESCSKNKVNYRDFPNMSLGNRWTCIFFGRWKNRGFKTRDNIFSVNLIIKGPMLHATWHTTRRVLQELTRGRVTCTRVY